ncbi:hypothetical protein VTI74DRAFT_3064 [Chaetomium olivicolor]
MNSHATHDNEVSDHGNQFPDPNPEDTSSRDQGSGHANTNELDGGFDAVNPGEAHGDDQINNGVDAVAADDIMSAQDGDEIIDTFDTPEEQLVPLVMGAICDHHIEALEMKKAETMEFEARAMELKHYKGKCFLLLVKSPPEDGVYQPKEGELCYVSLKGVQRVMPQVVRESPAAPTVDDIVKYITRASTHAEFDPDPDRYLRDACLQYFNSDLVTNKMVEELKCGEDEDPVTLKIRLKAVIQSWTEIEGLIVATKTEPTPVTEPDDKRSCRWWRAERIPKPIIGAPDGYTTDIVTIPLTPKSEAPENGPRPVINVDFKMLRWTDVTSIDREFVADCVKKHFDDEAMRLDVRFRLQSSERVVKAAVSAINDLHTPRAADREFPVSDWSISTYRYLMDSLGGKAGNVFEMFPHMENILKNPDQVPEMLRTIWERMDKHKQVAYAGLRSLKQNINWIVGVAGTGKTNLLVFMILMAMYGDNQDHPLEFLYFVNNNTAVNDFAEELNQAFADLRKDSDVLRNHGYESEVTDWMSSRMTNDQRREIFDEEDAKRACIGTEGQFIAQHQLAQFAIDTNDARLRSKKPRLPYLSLHERAYRYYLEHIEEYPELSKVLEGITSDAVPSEEVADQRKEIKSHVSRLYETFLYQFHGVICATLHAGCSSKLVRHFKADIIFVDEAGKVGELELLQIIRKHNPKFIVVVGDPNQLGPFVRQSRGDKVRNPWEEYLKRSTLERAFNVGRVIQTTLKLYHRAKGGLARLPSTIIYQTQMRPTAVGADARPETTVAWHKFMLKYCPTLHDASQRVLIELQGATTEKLGTSSFNRQHVEYACQVAVDAVKDDTLRGLGHKQKTILIVPFYKAQCYLYSAVLDKMVYDGSLSSDQRRQILVRTVDGAQGFAADLTIVDFVQIGCPGFTADRRRICVALTRSRQAEMILMSRGTFVGFQQSDDMPVGFDVHLLEMIYLDVRSFGGIVTERITELPADEGSTCFNCGQTGHTRKSCAEPMKCENCDQGDHVSRSCPHPVIPRCRHCRATDHTANCPKKIC